MACTIEATGAAGTVKITGDDTGNYQQQLAPGSYRLSISGCCEPAGRFEPEPPAMVELAAGVWQTLDLRCTIFGK